MIAQLLEFNETLRFPEWQGSNRHGKPQESLACHVISMREEWHDYGKVSKRRQIKISIAEKTGSEISLIARGVCLMCILLFRAENGM